jgi:hypothetical protein
LEAILLKLSQIHPLHAMNSHVFLVHDRPVLENLPEGLLVFRKYPLNFWLREKFMDFLPLGLLVSFLIFLIFHVSDHL